MADFTPIDEWEEILNKLYKIKQTQPHETLSDFTIVPRKISDDLLCLLSAMQDIRDSKNIATLLTKHPEMRVTLEAWLHNYLRPQNPGGMLSSSPTTHFLTQSMGGTNQKNQ